MGGVENVYLELWFNTEVDEQSTWHPVAGTEPASAPNGIKFNFEANVFPQGNVQFDGQLKHNLDEQPSLIGTRLCPISPVTTTAEIVTTPAETTPAPTTSIPLTMPTNGGDCIDIQNVASVENSWACRSCLQFLVNFNHDLTTIGGVQNAYLEIWFDTDVEVHSTWNPVAGTESASASNGIKFTFEADAFQQGAIQFDGQLKHNLGSQPSVVGVRLCPINPGWSTTTAEVITTTVAPTTTPAPLTMILPVMRVPMDSVSRVKTEQNLVLIVTSKLETLNAETSGRRCDECGIGFFPGCQKSVPVIRLVFRTTTLLSAISSI